MSKFGESKSVFDVVVGDFEATEGGEVGAGAEFFADVFGEGANISARAAVNVDFELGVIVIQDFYIIYGDFAGRNFKIFALAGQFVGTLAVYFDGTEARRDLGDCPHK